MEKRASKSLEYLKLLAEMFLVPLNRCRMEFLLRGESIPESLNDEYR